MISCGCLALALMCAGAGTYGQQPEIHQVVATTDYNTFARAHAVLVRVRPGDTVATKTLDASGRDEKGVQVARPSNPLTGAFYVEGAEPGDTLLVRFNKVRMNRHWGWTAYRLGLCEEVTCYGFGTLSVALIIALPLSP